MRRQVGVAILSLLSVTTLSAGGKIAFSTVRDGNREIYLMNDDGTNQVNLTQNSAFDGYPAISPDGSVVAFVSSRSGTQEIWMVPVTGGNAVQVTDLRLGPGISGVDWHPDGSHLIFAAGGGTRLFTVAPDGSQLTEIPNTVGGKLRFHPKYSLDGTRIYLQVRCCTAFGDDEVYVMAPDGSGTQRLTFAGAVQLPTEILVGGVVKVLFSRGILPNSGTFLMNRDGSGLQDISLTAGNEFYCHAPRNGEDMLAFTVGTMAGAIQLWKRTVDGSTLEQLTTMGGEEPFWYVDPALECVGFDAPMDQGPVTVRKNRVLPLKARLYFNDGSLVTDTDLVAPPVVEVTFKPNGANDVIDVTDLALPAGSSSEGNQFHLDEVGTWVYNLRVGNYTAPGTYTVTIVSGDEDTYRIDSCSAQFVVY